MGLKNGRIKLCIKKYSSSKLVVSLLYLKNERFGSGGFGWNFSSKHGMPHTICKLRKEGFKNNKEHVELGFKLKYVDKQRY